MMKITRTPNRRPFAGIIAATCVALACSLAGAAPKTQDNPARAVSDKAATGQAEGKMENKKKNEKQELAKGYVPAPLDESKRYGPAEGRKIKLFILSGQSNMAGQGISNELSDEWKRGDDRVLMFEDGKWQPLRPPRNMFGPEIAFAHAMAKAWPDETIGIVKQAWGGTGIMAWHPQWTKEKADMTKDGQKGNLWKVLTDKVRAALAAAPCEVMAFVWQQGGKDMQRIDTGKLYLENLKALVEGLRKETGAADLPVVLGMYSSDSIPDDLSDFDPSQIPDAIVGGRKGAPYVIKAQFDAQKALAPLKAVPLRDLERHPEDVHYNTNGQLALGKLFAEAYLKLADGASSSK